MESKKKYEQIFYWLLCILLIVIPIFARPNLLPIRLWDESRLAINALEMSHSHNWLIPTFDGHADMWNTKPPLLIWCQALLIKFFGPSPLALRFPVSFAVFFTILAIFKFVGQKTGSYLIGLCAALVLVTTPGYLCAHVARTGDYDGFLILFTTVSALAFFNYLEHKQPRQLYAFFLFLALAVLTKSIAGLLFLPGFALFALSQKQIIPLLKTKHFYLGSLLFLSVVFGYYLCREHYNPGYIKAVFENELGGRYLSTLEGNGSPARLYLEELYYNKFPYWIAFSIAGVIIGLLSTSKIIYRITLFCTLLVSTFFIIISFGKTKLDWYLAPIFPFMAILSAVAIQALILFIKTNAKHKTRTIIIASLCLIFCLPYSSIIIKQILQVGISQEEQNLYSLANYVRHNMNQEALSGHTIVSHDYIPNVQFYLAQAQHKGIDIKQQAIATLAPGDKVIIDNDAIENEIIARFENNKFTNVDNIRIIELGDKIIKK